MKRMPADFISMKNHEKITMLTCYDSMNAQILEQAGIDAILVGDSCANVFLGAESTRSINADRLAYHVEAVRNGAKETHIVADLDYESAQDPHKAVEAAKLFLKAGADSVKVEGYHPKILFALSDARIPLVGHVGLLPQTADRFTVQGKEQEKALAIIHEAQNIQEVGAFMIVCECIPSSLGRSLQKATDVPIIGIGAGCEVDGQVLVLNDMLGLTSHTARFVRNFAHLHGVISDATADYINAVKLGEFPDEKESYR